MNVFTNEWRFCSHGWKKRKTKSLFPLQTSDLCCVDESGLFIIVFPSKYCSCFPPDIPRHKQSVLATENPRINENLINFHMQKTRELRLRTIMFYTFLTTTRRPILKRKQALTSSNSVSLVVTSYVMISISMS